MYYLIKKEYSIKKGKIEQKEVIYQSQDIEKLLTHEEVISYECGRILEDYEKEHIKKGLAQGYAIEMGYLTFISK